MRNSRKASSYLPSMYRGFVEMDYLVSAEDAVLDSGEVAEHDVEANQFVLTAKEPGIEQYEKMLGIIPNPAVETLQFRRERLINRLSMTPPFSFRFLKRKLDEIIGVDKWNGYIDFDNYTIYIESSATNQIWFDEIAITMTSLKPANMVFTNRPLITQRIVAGEEIDYSTKQHNYVLGVSWVLGAKPFVEYIDKGAIKMSNVSSLQPSLFNDVAEFTASDISSVLINDDVIITTFDAKKATDNVVTVQYIVNKASVDEITSIKLRNSSGDILSQAIVYVPLVEDVIMKHTIKVKEGIER